MHTTRLKNADKCTEYTQLWKSCAFDQAEECWQMYWIHAAVKVLCIWPGWGMLRIAHSVLSHSDCYQSLSHFLSSSRLVGYLFHFTACWWSKQGWQDTFAQTNIIVPWPWQWPCLWLCTVLLFVCIYRYLVSYIFTFRSSLLVVCGSLRNI